MATNAFLITLCLAAGICLATAGPANLRSRNAVASKPEDVLLALETCCGDLGCYSSGGDFWQFPDRPLSLVPICELRYFLKFHLNTRRNPESTQQVGAYNAASIRNSDFDATKKTQIIIHGFVDNFQWPWWKQTVLELLKSGDSNVIRLDWNWGNLPPYTQATANVRLVGAFVAQFIDYLVKDFGVLASDVHIIGHSLGAHGAGYTGAVTQSSYGFKVGRITGLDPAGPYFTNLPETVRLDPGDADVVDTLVTDGETLLQFALGSWQPMGHINFFPNGGKEQPGCKKSILGLQALITGPTMDTDIMSPIGIIAATAFEAVACNHARAVVLFHESINTPLCMKSYECSDYESFLRGDCFTCKGGKCADLGFHANTRLAVRGQTKNYYTMTTARSPFCTSPHKIRFSLQTSGSQNSYDSKKKSGKVYVTLYGTKGTSARVELTPKDIDLVPGKQYTFFFETPRDLGDIRSVVFHWVVDIFLLNPIDWIRSHYIFIEGNIRLTEKDEIVSEFIPASAKVETEKDVQARFSHSYEHPGNV